MVVLGGGRFLMSEVPLYIKGLDSPWERKETHQSSHQPPEVNYVPCFENDDLPCRVTLQG